MKRNNLKFGGKRFYSHAQRMTGITFQFRKDDGGEGGDDDGGEDGGGDADGEVALLKKIEKQVGDHVREMNLKNKESIASAVNEAMKVALGGMSIENIRAFEKDKARLETSIRTMAANMDKILKQPQGKRERKVGDELRALLEHKMNDIQRIHTDKEGQTQIVLNMRAAAKMTTDGNPEYPTPLPEDIIESFSIDAFVPKRRPYEYVWDLVDRATVADISQYKTWLEEGAEDGAFAIVAEGTVKPLVSFQLVRNTSEYKKIAGKSIFTEEFTKFRKEAYAIIRRLFNDKLLRDYSAAITLALQAKAVPYTGTALDAQYTNPTDYHAIGAAAAQSETLNFVPDTLVLNPQDKWRIGLSQNAEGTFYTNIPMYNPAGEVTMLGFRVVTSNKQAVGTFTLAEGRLFKVEDQPVTIKIGYGVTVTKNAEGTAVTDVESDFDNNQFRIIGETYFHAYLPTNFNGSIIAGNFADIKNALQKP